MYYITRASLHNNILDIEVYYSQLSRVEIRYLIRAGYHVSVNHDLAVVRIATVLARMFDLLKKDLSIDVSIDIQMVDRLTRKKLSVEQVQKTAFYAMYKELERSYCVNVIETRRLLQDITHTIDDVVHNGLTMYYLGNDISKVLDICRETVVL